MGVREQLALITEALEESRGEMDRGLLSITRHINESENGKMWRIQVEWYNGYEMQPEEILVPIFSLSDPYWQPTVGGSMPYGYGELYTIRSFTKEWHPLAKDASDRYNSKHPYLTQLMGGEARDVDKLITLPEEVGKFYESWQKAASALTPLPKAMDGVLEVDTRVSWSGPGYIAYKPVVKATKESATAAQTAIKQLQDHALAYVERGLDLCKILRDVARMQADNVVDTVQALSTQLDPKKWLGIVNTLVDAVQGTNDQHRAIYDAGLEALSDVSQMLSDIENTFTDLATATGSPVDGIEWPPPHEQMGERWDGEPA